MNRLLPLLASMALLVGLVSLAHAQETTTDTSSDPPVAQQQNSPVKLADNTDEVDDEDDGLVAGFVAGDPGATPPSAASYRSYAVSFTTGSDAGWYQLVEVLIATKVTGTPLARLSIHRDHQGSPHAEALYVTHFRGASEEDPDLYLEFPDNTPLNPNQTYWAVFEEVSGLGVYEISTAPNGDEDPDSWPISDTSLQRNFFSLAGRTWQASALNPIAMVVDGYPVEERVLVGAHGLRDTAADGPFLRFGTERVTKVWLKLPKGRTYDGGATNPNIRIDCEPRFVEGPYTETSWRLCSTNRHYDHEWAGGRGFTTGPHPTGYTISGLGVDIDAQSGTLDPVADIYAAEAFSSREGARDPQSPLASYQATAGIGGSPDRFAPRTGSQRLHVDPERLPTWPTSKTPPPATTKHPTPAPARTWALKPAGPSADPTAAALSIRWVSAGTTGTTTTSSSGSRSTSTAGRTRCRPPRTRLPRRPAPCWSAPWVSRRTQPANLSARESTWKLGMRLHSPTAAMRFIPFVVCKLK